MLLIYAKDYPPFSAHGNSLYQTRLGGKGPGYKDWPRFG